MFLQNGAKMTDLRKVNKHLDIVDRKEAGSTTNGTLEPVIINTCQKFDHVSLVERQLSVVLRLEVVQCLGTRTATCTQTDNSLIYIIIM